MPLALLAVVAAGGAAMLLAPDFVSTAFGAGLCLFLFGLAALALWGAVRLFRRRRPLPALAALPLLVLGLLFALLAAIAGAELYAPSLRLGQRFAVAAFRDHLPFRAPAGKLDAAAWREDLAALDAALRRRHPRFARGDLPAGWDAAVRRLEADIPRLGSLQTAARMAALVARIGDAHTQVAIPHPAMPTAVLPVDWALFPDGLHVLRAGGGAHRAAGCRVLRIGRSDVAAVLRDLAPLVSAENDAWRRQRLPGFLRLPHLLAARGHLTDPDSVDLLVECAPGERSTVRVRPVPFLFYALEFLRPVGRDAPAAASGRREAYWLERRAGSGTLYVQVNALRNQEESAAAFAERLRAAVERRPFTRLVFDLRSCEGGNNRLAEALVRVAALPRVDRPGRLFALVGRGTFSACMNLASALERRTGAVFAGEATGNSPNQYGDAEPLLLPRSGLLVLISSRAWLGSLPGDRRRTLAPDLPVTTTHADVAAGRDPVLAAVERVRPSGDAAPTVPGAPAGRAWYLLGGFLRAELAAAPGGARLRAEDFEPLFDVALRPAGPGRWLGRPGVELRFDSTAEGWPERAELRWKGAAATLVRAPTRPELAIERLLAGDLAGGAPGLRAQAAAGALDSRTELRLNDRGYELLERGEVEAAIGVFRLAVALFPTSLNTHDSLAEALRARRRGSG